MSSRNLKIKIKNQSDLKNEIKDLRVISVRNSRYLRNKGLGDLSGVIDFALMKQKQTTNDLG